MPRAEEIVRALKGQWRGNGGVCRCPAHDDRNPSLCVTEQDGRVLAHCHARCRQEAVLGALARAGFDIRQSSSGGADVHNYRHPELDKPSRTWPYHDAKGRIVAYVARFETQSGKEFRPLGPLRTGGTTASKLGVAGAGAQRCGRPSIGRDQVPARTA